MKNSKEWFSVSELLSEKLKDLPSTDKGISKKADREGWQKRQRTGVKGKTFEYNVRSMPENIQEALGFVISLPNSPQKTRDDFILQTPSGGEFGLELKARRLKKGANTNELMQAIALIEEAVTKIGKDSPGELNNIEWHLVQCFRSANEQGRVAILNIAETMAAIQDKEKEEAGKLSEDSKVA